MSKILIVIPARIGSSRLASKMLRPLCGKALILWSYESACQCASLLSEQLRNDVKVDVAVDVVVASDDRAILSCVERAGGRAIMTASSLATGSDRVWAALDGMAGVSGYETIINYQGDLPLCSARVFCDGVAAFRASGADIATPVVSIGEEQARNPAVVKALIARECLRGGDGSSCAWAWAWATGFTRSFAQAKVAASAMTLDTALAASTLDGQAKGYHQHIGVYIYGRDSLERFASLPRSRSECRESLEQLRAVDAGMKIAVFPCARALIEINLESDIVAFESLSAAEREQLLEV